MTTSPIITGATADSVSIATKLLELAEQCEAAPAEQQSSYIKDAGSKVYDYGSDAKEMRRFFQLLRASAYLDAAMTLVPEQDETRAVFWRLGNDGEGGNPGDFKAEVLVASTFAAKEFVGLADTAPLALCAAALRARAAQ